MRLNQCQYFTLKVNLIHAALIALMLMFDPQTGADFRIDHNAWHGMVHDSFSQKGSAMGLLIISLLIIKVKKLN